MVDRFNHRFCAVESELPRLCKRFEQPKGGKNDAYDGISGVQGQAD